jgi:hypothetical protein
MISLDPRILCVLVETKLVDENSYHRLPLPLLVFGVFASLPETLNFACAIKMANFAIIPVYFNAT